MGHITKKQKREWQPHRDVRVNDLTDKGKVVGVEQDFPTKKSMITKTGTTVVFEHRSDLLRQSCESEITHNYTRMKRQIETLLTAAERAPSRKSAERDLCNFFKISREEIREIKDFSSMLEKLTQMEKSVVVEKAASRFGV